MTLQLTPDNQSIIMWMGGRFGPVSRFEATLELLHLEGSPHPESQERARQIKAAIIEARKRDEQH